MDGMAFDQLFSNRLSGVHLQYVINDGFLTYDAVLAQPLQSITGTRKVHQVVSQGNMIYCRLMSCFCSETQICHCINPVAHQFHGISQHQDAHGAVRLQSPLAMLMEEMENEPSRPPEGLTTMMGAKDVEMGDCLVMYDHNWWLAKALRTGDVQVEFFHPHGPNSRFQRKQGSQDVCFVPFSDVIVNHKYQSVQVVPGTYSSSHQRSWTS